MLHCKNLNISPGFEIFTDESASNKAAINVPNPFNLISKSNNE